jgi:hypothetical protein
VQLRRLLLSLAATVGLLVQPRAAVAAPLHAQSVDSSLGYFGCLVAFTGSRYFCVAAWETEGAVRVVVLNEGSAGVVTEKFVDEATVPAESLRWVDGGVELAATLPRTGPVFIRSTALQRGPVSSNRACSAYALSYDIVANGGASAIAISADSGTIDGESVGDLRCNAHFTGGVRAVWTLAVLVEEGVVPA